MTGEKKPDRKEAGEVTRHDFVALSIKGVFALALGTAGSLAASPEKASAHARAYSCTHGSGHQWVGTNNHIWVFSYSHKHPGFARHCHVYKCYHKGSDSGGHSDGLAFVGYRHRRCRKH